MGADVVGEEEVELPDGDVDVVRVDTEAGVQTVRGLLQPLPVCALQGNSFKQDHLNQVKAPHLEITKYNLNILLSYTPHLVGLSEAVYPPHLALLVGVGEDAHGRLLARDGQHKVLPALLGDVLPQLPQQAGGPLLLHLQLLGDQLLLAPPLLLETHSLLVLLEVFPLGSLQVEPGVGERLHVRQQGLDERVELILQTKRSDSVKVVQPFPFFLVDETFAVLVKSCKVNFQSLSVLFTMTGTAVLPK